MEARVLSRSDLMNYSKVMYMVVFVTAALISIGLGYNQIVTGTLINALLLLTAEKVGLSEAIFLGMITPIAAAARGVLPVQLLIMLPFIVVGNSVYIIVYKRFAGINRFVGVFLAALFKFIFLFGVTYVLALKSLSVIVSGQSQMVVFAAPIINMMRIPQLLTALSGGALAVGLVIPVLDRIKKTDKDS